MTILAGVLVTALGVLEWRGRGDRERLLADPKVPEHMKMQFRSQRGFWAVLLGLGLSLLVIGVADAL